MFDLATKYIKTFLRTVREPSEFGRALLKLNFWNQESDKK